ncbi:hypothetical protein NQ317_009735 [Molorchus minor]|uniref:Insulin-like domain-containing protein n=1 Tax=Molorchus minor TaxID=1323400 RepID=A0ABQ9JF32_9CUCU|nr:hypothetical protein NQ317_009735 [Molorchus minor]
MNYAAIELEHLEFWIVFQIRGPFPPTCSKIQGQENMNCKVIFILMMNILYVCSSPYLKHLLTKRSRYCGSSLTDVLSLVCHGIYATPQRRSCKNVINGKLRVFIHRLTVSDMLNYNDFMPEYHFGEHDHGNNGYPFISKEVAEAVIPQKMRRNGVVDECCYNSCSISEMMNYCAPQKQTIDFIVNNLQLWNGNFKQLTLLPNHIKNRILKIFNTSSYFWTGVDFHKLLSAMVNNDTCYINLTATTLDDAMLNTLSDCKNLKKVYLTRTENHIVTTAGLINLFKRANQLLMIQISNCIGVDDSVLDCLADNCPNLMGLDVGGCTNITDNGAKRLATLSNVTWLTFSQTQVSDDGITAIVTSPSGSKIRELRIDNCLNVTEAGLKVIAENCPNIEILMFYNCWSGGGRVSDETISSLYEENLKNLKQINYTITW